MKNTFLSIIIPCFNERKTIVEIINRIKLIKKIKKQIILIDDYSSDGTRSIIKKKLLNKVNKIIFHKTNKGKGSAIISSQKFIKGNLVIIQDADLEYCPKDYYKLIKPFKNKKTNIVYGSRVLGRKSKINLFNIYDISKNFRIFANYVLTKISNIINNQSLTDVHTCYKVFRKDIFLSLNLKEKDFAFCPEVTTKIAKLGYQILEVPITYNGRNFKEGKKIQLKDAFKALYTIIKYRYSKF